jgi:ribosomal protein L40E
MSPKELQELRERMSKNSDEDLLKIVNVDFKDYRKEAVDLARGELEKRGLSDHLKISPTTAETLPQDYKQVGSSSNMDTVECKFCGAVISATATECDSCGYGTPYGVSLEEEQEVEEAQVERTVASPAKPDSTSQRDSSAGTSSQASAVMKRYKDAYIVARVTNGFGGMIKAIGIIIGGLLALVGFMVASNGGPRDLMSILGIAGIVVGIIAGAWFYIVGVLVSAQGQILKASLDSAVNNSPFLTNKHRAKIMSLPEA